MAVYVDSARNKFARMVMCHMIADSPEELHAMADQIGMKRDWYQSPDKASFPHYDLSATKRTAAIRAGAAVVDRRGLNEAMKRIKAQILADGKTWRSAGWL